MFNKKYNLNLIFNRLQIVPSVTIRIMARVASCSNQIEGSHHQRGIERSAMWEGSPYLQHSLEQPGKLPCQRCFGCKGCRQRAPQTQPNWCCGGFWKLHHPPTVRLARTGVSYNIVECEFWLLWMNVPLYTHCLLNIRLAKLPFLKSKIEGLQNYS